MAGMKNNDHDLDHPSENKLMYGHVQTEIQMIKDSSETDKKTDKQTDTESGMQSDESH